jgi:hypothetical protein
MRRVIVVRALPDYRVDVTFDDGVSGMADLSHLVGKGVFHAWLDAHAFEQVRIGTDGELVWDSNIDICPCLPLLEGNGVYA